MLTFFSTWFSYLHNWAKPPSAETPSLSSSVHVTVMTSLLPVSFLALQKVKWNLNYQLCIFLRNGLWYILEPVERDRPMRLSWRIQSHPVGLSSIALPAILKQTEAGQVTSPHIQSWMTFSSSQPLWWQTIPQLWTLTRNTKSSIILNHWS